MPRMTFHQFYDLSSAAQESAIAMCVNELLELIVVSGVIKLDDAVLGNDLQERINTALACADEIRTPWFAQEYIMDTCREDIQEIACAYAEGILYVRGSRQVARVLPNDTMCRA